MTIELTLLTWTLVLAIVQTLLHSLSRSKETGLAYSASARDGVAPPPRPVTARLERAKQNLFETLPLFIAAILITHVTGLEGDVSRTAAWMYFLSRVAYVPLYAFGIPNLRSVVWAVGLAGLVILIANLLA